MGLASRPVIQKNGGKPGNEAIGSCMNMSTVYVVCTHACVCVHICLSVCVCVSE